ncbi:MAG: HlyC/CorC family transporter [Clostridia bacterium]|nr:HlyC/CorC family transporter [Clostridia bacterium]
MVFLFMDPSSTLCLLSCLVLLGLSAFFSASESAFVGANRIKLKTLAENGNRRAALALSISEKFDSTLTAILVGNCLVNTVCASLATVFTLRLFGEMTPVQTTAATLVTTAVVILFGEIAPKTLANYDNDAVAVAFAPFLRFLLWILTPLTLLFSGLTVLVSKISGGSSEPTVTEDEISSIIETGEEEGVIDEEQSDLLQSALEFGGTRVADVLTLWDDVTFVTLSMSQNEVLELIRSTKYSRLPVLEKDRVVGILLVRSYLRSYMTTGRADLRRLMTKPTFVPLDAPIDDLLDEMSRNKCCMAIVRDKNGKNMGLVTIEDFLEELVGEIYDEDDKFDPNFAKLGGNYFEASGNLTLGALYDRMGYENGDKSLRGKRIHTFLLERMGRLPEEGEEYETGDLHFTVDEVTDDRITRVTVKLDTPELDLPPMEEDGEEADEK